MRNAILLAALWSGAALVVWGFLRHGPHRFKPDPDMDTRRKVELLSHLLGHYVEIRWEEGFDSHQSAAGVLLAITEDVQAGTAWLELDWGYGVDVNARGLVVNARPRPTDLSHDHS